MYLGVTMRTVLLGALALACTTNFAAAQQAGGVAYPDNWNGGPPLPPINQSRTYAVQPQGYYVQPQVQYVQPRVQYIQPQVQYVQPRNYYVQPNVVYVQPQVGYSQRVYYPQTSTYFVSPRTEVLDPQTILSRQRAHQYRFGQSAPQVIYVTN